MPPKRAKTGTPKRIFFMTFLQEEGSGTCNSISVFFKKNAHIHIFQKSVSSFGDKKSRRSCILKIQKQCLPKDRLIAMQQAAFYPFSPPPKKDPPAAKSRWGDLIKSEYFIQYLQIVFN